MTADQPPFNDTDPHETAEQVAALAAVQSVYDLYREGRASLPEGIAGLLLRACDNAGVQLGERDRRILTSLTGINSGTAVAEMSATVAGLRAELAALTAKAAGIRKAIGALATAIGLTTDEVRAIRRRELELIAEEAVSTTTDRQAQRSGLAAELAQVRAEVAAVRAEVAALAEAARTVSEVFEVARLTVNAVAAIDRDGYERGYRAALNEKEAKRRRAKLTLIRDAGRTTGGQEGSPS